MLTVVMVLMGAAMAAGSARALFGNALLPLDLDTIVRSVKKTGRCVIAHEATRTCGFGAASA